MNEITNRPFIAEIKDRSNLSVKNINGIEKSGFCVVESTTYGLGGKARKPKYFVLGKKRNGMKRIPNFNVTVSLSKGNNASPEEIQEIAEAGLDAIFKRMVIK